MIALTKFLGWAANVMLAAMLIDGFFHVLTIGSHFRWGLAVVMLLPLIYLLPYFHLIGVASRLKHRAQDHDPDKVREFQLALQLKGRLFLPVLVAVLACIVGPILGFLQPGGLLPPHVHGVYMIGFTILHVVTWVRILFVLNISAKLGALASSQ